MTPTHEQIAQALTVLGYENARLQKGTYKGDPDRWVYDKEPRWGGYAAVKADVGPLDLASLLRRCVERKLIVHLEAGAVAEHGEHGFSVEIGNRPGRPTGISFDDPTNALILALAAMGQKEGVT